MGVEMPVNPVKVYRDGFNKEWNRWRVYPYMTGQKLFEMIRYGEEATERVTRKSEKGAWDFVQDRCILAGLAAVDEARRISRQRLIEHMDAIGEDWGKTDTKAPVAGDSVSGQ
jgi:hypothetical protein